MLNVCAETSEKVYPKEVEKEETESQATQYNHLHRL